MGHLITKGNNNSQTFDSYFGGLMRLIYTGSWSQKSSGSRNPIKETTKPTTQEKDNFTSLTKTDTSNKKTNTIKGFDSYFGGLMRLIYTGSWSQKSSGSKNPIKETTKPTTQEKDDFTSSTKTDSSNKKTNIINGKEILPLDRSGKERYPLSHSTFANTLQEDTTLTLRNLVASGYYRASYDFTNREETLKYLDSTSNYSTSATGFSIVDKRIEYGLSYINQLADEIKNGGKKKSLGHHLQKISSGKDDLNHVPVYALGEKSSLESNVVPEFEVCIATAGDETDIIYSAYVLEHVLTKTYGDKVKNIKILRYPSIAKYEEALKEKGISCRENGRQLYTFILGHGGYAQTEDKKIYYPSDIKPEDYDKQGSREYGAKFKDKSYLESDYKKFLNANLNDVETIHTFCGCHTGAAIR